MADLGEPSLARVMRFIELNPADQGLNVGVVS
jgi:hypothetical protein